MLPFHVNANSGTPLYLQVELQLKHAIAAGCLKCGDALPPIRKLAIQLRINPNTVARAYQNLERDGVLRTVSGEGTYVAESAPGLSKPEKLRRLRPLVMQMAVEGMQLRLAPDDLMTLLRGVLDDLGRRP